MTATILCAGCGHVCTSHHWMCDRRDGVWCNVCFHLTPCGKGKHGEGCPTQVFDSAPNVEAVQRVRALETQKNAIEDQLDDAIKEAWPIGSSVQWMKTGRHPAFGEVTHHGYGRLTVRNADSGKTVQITPYHISRAAQGESAG